MHIGASSYQYSGTGYTIVPPDANAFQLRARNFYDAVGRLITHSEYAGFDAVNAVVSRTVGYDTRGRVQNESNFARKADGKTYTSTTYNYYNFDGTLASANTTSLVNNRDAVTSSTTNQYLWWDGAVQSTVTYRPDTSKPNTAYTSTYDYNPQGHLTKVRVADGRYREISFTNDMAGQVLMRSETGASPAPIQHYYYYNGRQLGSNGNNGNDTPDYATALAENLQAPPSGTAVRAFRAGAIGTGSDNGLTDGAGPNAYANFDAAYDPVSSSSFAGGAQAWTVKQGESLEGIAQNLWGDASLWYMLAEANGIRSSAELRAGQALQVPNKLANVHNTSDTFLPYDASKAIGDTQPTTPKPPKKPKCGVFGQLLLAAIAIAVAVILTPAGAGILTQIGAAVAGSVVSQTVGVITGIQDKFSFKSVALAALSAGIGAGVGDVIKGAVAGSQLIGDVVRGAITSAATQGVAVATGLQDKFSWVGVATAGVAAGVGGLVSRNIGGANGRFANDADIAGGVSKGSWVSTGSPTFTNSLISGMAGGIAAAGLRSIATGTNFGDNLLATLPDVIGSTIGRAVGGEVNKSRALSASARDMVAAERQAVRMAGSHMEGEEPLLLADDVNEWLGDKDYWKARYQINRDRYEYAVRNRTALPNLDLQTLFAPYIPNDEQLQSQSSSFNQTAVSQFADYQPGKGLMVQKAGLSDWYNTVRRWGQRAYNYFTRDFPRIVMDSRIPGTNTTIRQTLRRAETRLSQAYGSVQRTVSYIAREGEEIVVNALRRGRDFVLDSARAYGEAEMRSAEAQREGAAEFGRVMRETFSTPTQPGVRSGPGLDIMGQPLNGRSNFDRPTQIGNVWDDRGNVSGWTTLKRLYTATTYTVPDAAQRNAEIFDPYRGMTPEGRRFATDIDRIRSSPISGSAYGAALASGADQDTADLIYGVTGSLEGIAGAYAGARGRIPGAGNQTELRPVGIDFRRAPPISARLQNMGTTPDKFSRTGADVVDRMRLDGLIIGEGPLLRGNPNNLQLVLPNGQRVRIDETIDMAHRLDAVTWWNTTGRYTGQRSPAVREFMLDSNNYVLQPRSVNRSEGGQSGERYLPAATPDIGNRR